ncbi:MAG: hypothetical protein ACLRL0_00440 [Christensenellaceae bacterium]
MAEVKLWKKQAPYTNKDGEERTATNFFVDCGGIFVPVEVKYFEDKETGRDDHYRERKTLLTAFADTLPDKEKNSSTKKQATTIQFHYDVQTKKTDFACQKCGKSMIVGDIDERGRGHRDYYLECDCGCAATIRDNTLLEWYDPDMDKNISNAPNKPIQKTLSDKDMDNIPF